MKKSILIFFLLVLFIPLSTKAAGLVPCGGSDDPSTIKDESLPCTVCDLLVLFQNVLKKALEFAFLIVIVFIVYGGFCWIFSGGNEANIKTGQKIMTNAMIGLVIILCAWLIVNTVFWLIAEIGGTNYTNTWFKIDCENPTPGDGNVGDGNEGDGNEGDGENEWSNAIQYEIEDPEQILCTPIEISKECETKFKLNKAKCEPGDYTKMIESKKIYDKEGWYCKFQGKRSGSGYPPFCHPPKGILYLDCVIDTSGEQIETKKNEIEKKYPDLNGEWKEAPIGCPDWQQDCDEAQGSAECGIQAIIKDGFCFATEPTKLLDPPGEKMGNGWHCIFEKTDANISGPSGKSFAYCISNTE